MPKITVVWSPRCCGDGNFYWAEGEWRSPNDAHAANCDKWHVITGEALEAMLGQSIGPWHPGEWDVFTIAAACSAAKEG